MKNLKLLDHCCPVNSFSLRERVGVRGEVGSIYYTRQKGTKNWTAYRVLTLEHNFKMSAEIYGNDRLFEALRYEHKFVIEGDKTISYEKVDYKCRFGIVGHLLNLLIGKKLVRKQVLDAHLKLKEKAERL